MNFTIDLNCDLGEGAGHDAELMPLITSANIACGGHAGDLDTMRATSKLARLHGVSVGAHPGFVDRENFGRRELSLPLEEVRELVRTQVSALRALGPVAHVKPHGALYNLAARDRAVATAIVEGILAVDATLCLFALAESELVRVGRERGLRVASEVFADRTYQKDGSLTPRSQRNALLANAEESVQQVLRMLREGVVRATDGTHVPIVAETVCLHGDGAHAVEFARRLKVALLAEGILLKAFLFMSHLLGIFLIVVGFSLRLNTLLVVLAAGIVTGLTAGFSLTEIVALIGKYFVDNRTMTLPIVLMLPVIGLLERHGLKERAETLIRRAQAATAGRVILTYTACRQLSVSLGIQIGGHAQMVRPLIAPMAEAAAKVKHGELPSEAVVKIRAHAAAGENIGNFFGEDIFIAVGGILLMKGFFETQGIKVSVWEMALWGIPTALIAFAAMAWRCRQLDRRVAQAVAAYRREVVR